MGEPGAARAATRWYRIPVPNVSGVDSPDPAAAAADMVGTAAVDTATAAMDTDVVATMEAAVRHGAATAAEVSMPCWSL